jgi:RNA polymerase sigma-70 factor (ECF subfamily)
MQQQNEAEQTVGSEADIAGLFDRYGRAIFAYVRLHTPSVEDAEDVTLEVFAAALEEDNLLARQEEERLAWLRRVAHNKLVDRYRQLARRPSIALDRIAKSLFEDESRSPEQLALRSELYTQLYEDIKMLPPMQQQLLKLHYGDGLRLTEIATLFKKREEAIRKMHSRTLAFLRARQSQPQRERR